MHGAEKAAEETAKHCEMKPDFTPPKLAGPEMRERRRTLFLSCVACWSSFGLNLAGAVLSGIASSEHCDLMKAVFAEEDLRVLADVADPVADQHPLMERVEVIIAA